MGSTSGFSSSFSRSVSDGQKLLTPALRDLLGAELKSSQRSHWHLGKQDKMFKTADQYGKELASEGDHLVVCGIGGSGLGIRAFSNFLLPVSQWHRVTVLDHVDPAYLSEWLAETELSRCVFCVISKSGQTIETLSQWLLFHHLLLKKGLKGSALKSRVVVISSPQKNPLTTYAEKENIRQAQIPRDVGGRFSILSSVGLIPLAFLGCDLGVVQDAMNEAHKNFELSLLKPDKHQSALQDAATWVNASQNGISQWILMAYHKKFFAFTQWAAQLVAESLGKQRLNQTPVGLLPLPAQGVTDQHSYLQYLIEGPDSSMTTFFEFPFPEKLKTGSSTSAMKDPLWATLENKTFSEIHQTECQGTQLACDQNNRPYQRIVFGSRDLGAVTCWIIYFQQLIATMGHIMNINPYDQPGVELGKQETLKRLQKI
jgi:glucose-6-phosphate isomerase